MTQASERALAERAELDRRVLAHITTYPGLGAYEIARALRVHSDTTGAVNKAKIDAALFRLVARELVHCVEVKSSGPTLAKRTWYEGKRPQ